MTNTWVTGKLCLQEGSSLVFTIFWLLLKEGGSLKGTLCRVIWWVWGQQGGTEPAACPGKDVLDGGEKGGCSGSKKGWLGSVKGKEGEQAEATCGWREVLGGEQRCTMGASLISHSSGNSFVQTSLLSPCYVAGSMLGVEKRQTPALKKLEWSVSLFTEASWSEFSLGEDREVLWDAAKIGAG